MEKLKDKIFELMAGMLSVSQLEKWLYSDTAILDALPDNEMVLELLCINMKSRHAMHEVKKFCFEYYTKEEYLISIVELN